MSTVLGHDRRGAATPAVAAPRPGVVRRDWAGRYAGAVVAADGVVAAATAAALAPGPPHVAAAAAAVAWPGALALSGAHHRGVLGAGAEEYRRVLRAGVHLLAAVAVVDLVSDVAVPGGALAVLAATAAATVAARRALREWLHRRRAAGSWSHRVVAVGRPDDVARLGRHLDRAPHAGYRVVAACVPDTLEPVDVGGRPVPVLGGPADAVAAAASAGTDTIAVASALGPEAVRRLGWELEGTGIDLVVVPAVTDVAGPRVRIRPVSGLPLLHVDEPRRAGPGRMVSELGGRVLAAVALLVLAPVLVAIAVAVRASSPGPVLFRQSRVGRAGRPFTMLKFRTMADGADRDLDLVIDLNEHDGPLFKVRCDPRVTPVGRWLRRFSLDELPQLWNVLWGDMAVVGPRPPLPEEVAHFGGDGVHRRFLVKPGLTGLWQVSGRADLPWHEAVRLDLYYVENWSLALDITILWKTARAVVQGRGAY